MTNIVYDYPKSSCQCYNCNYNKYDGSEKGVPSSISVRDCSVPQYYECYDRREFKSNIEPTNNSGYEYLNPQVSQNLFSRDFQKFSCEGNKSQQDDRFANCNTVYASSDPRLIDVPRSEIMPLDRPPYDSAIKLNEIYTDPKLRNYGKGYRTYSDIYAGQISYYVNRSQEDAFYEPNFTTSSQMIGTLYKDPMGSIKPQYDIYPLTCNNPITSHNDNYEGELSWIQDSQFHRQDLMAKQMRTRNQTLWQPRWTNINN